MAKKSDTCFVVAISGSSGSGKTTLVEAATKLLEDAVALHFDDYASVSIYPFDLQKWLADGADPNEWRTPKLAKDLKRLRNGKEIRLPSHGNIIVRPAKFIVLEEPFGRERCEMMKYIDFVACINPPPEVAFARRVLRNVQWISEKYGNTSAEKHLEQILKWVTSYPQAYLEKGLREFYLEVNRQVLRNCDIVLDGLKPVANAAEELVRAVRKRTDELGGVSEKADGPNGLKESRHTPKRRKT